MKNPRKTSEICENDEEANAEGEEITAAETETFQKILRSPSLKRFLSEDDNDSLVSAESVSRGHLGRGDVIEGCFDVLVVQIRTWTGWTRT